MECHALKTRLVLLIGCVLLCSTMWTGSIAGTAAPAAVGLHAGGAPLPPSFECGGEPCDAVLRGLRAFADRTPHGLVGNGRACADCHMPADSFQLSPSSVEARFQLLQWRRRSNPD